MGRQEWDDVTFHRNFVNFQNFEHPSIPSYMLVLVAKMDGSEALEAKWSCLGRTPDPDSTFHLGGSMQYQAPLVVGPKKLRVLSTTSKLKHMAKCGANRWLDCRTPISPWEVWILCNDLCFRELKSVWLGIPNKISSWSFYNFNQKMLTFVGWHVNSFLLNI